MGSVASTTGLIKASYVIKPAESLAAAKGFIERYTSISTEEKIDSMLEKLYSVFKGMSGGGQAAFVERMARYSSKLAKPVLLGASGQYMIEIHVPMASFDLRIDGVPHLLAMFAGNVFRTNVLKSIKWVDLSFPDHYLEEYPDILPRFGIRGIKHHLGIGVDNTRPLIAANIQPAFGLTAEELRELCVYVSKAGADIIVEDELLKELPFCKMLDRISLVSDALEDGKQKVIYLVNALGWSEEILQLAASQIKTVNERNKFVLTGIIIDPIFSGFGLMRMFRNEAQCPIFCHYYSSGFFTRAEEFGVSMAVLTRLAVLAGADIVYVGSVVGSHIAEEPAVLQYCAESLRNMSPIGVFPAVAGGICAQNLIVNLRHFGLDVVLHSGAGLFGHPFGPKGGIEVFKRLIELASSACMTCERQSCAGCEDLVTTLRDNPAVRLSFQDSVPITRIRQVPTGREEQL